MNRLFLPREAVHFGPLILVNPRYPHRPRRVPEPTGVPAPGSPVQLEAQAAQALNRLMEELQGWQAILPVSGWRSRGEQQALWDRSLAENGPDFTAAYVARPGHSEHETGLAIDLGLRSADLDFIRPAFPYQGICQAVRDLAPQYGFVQRYPAGKEAVTGIGHEPWHFRYVGQPHAALMAQQGLTLEEYLTLLRDHHPYDQAPLVTTEAGRPVWVAYLPAAGETTVLDLPEGLVCQVSGDNAGGFIITTRRTQDVRTEILRRP